MSSDSESLPHKETMFGLVEPKDSPGLLTD